MILGLRTAIYPTPDIAQAKEWYGKVFEATPYFDEPCYVGYAVGGFELGLIPDATPGTAGPKAYWGVANLADEIARLAGLGITSGGAVIDVGAGILVADLTDPFGNVVGLMENPHFSTAKVR